MELARLAGEFAGGGEPGLRAGHARGGLPLQPLPCASGVAGACPGAVLWLRRTAERPPLPQVRRGRRAAAAAAAAAFAADLTATLASVAREAAEQPGVASIPRRQKSRRKSSRDVAVSTRHGGGRCSACGGATAQPS